MPRSPILEKVRPARAGARRETLEDVFNRVDAVVAAEGDDEVAEDFPGVVGIAVGVLTALLRRWRRPVALIMLPRFFRRRPCREARRCSILALALAKICKVAMNGTFSRSR